MFIYKIGNGDFTGAIKDVREKISKVVQKERIKENTNYESFRNNDLL